MPGRPSRPAWDNEYRCELASRAAAPKYWGLSSLLAPSLPPPAPDAAPPASAALAAAAAACIRAASPVAPERLRRDLDGYPRKRKAAGQPTDQ